MADPHVPVNVSAPTVPVFCSVHPGGQLPDVANSQLPVESIASTYPLQLLSLVHAILQSEAERLHAHL